MIRLALWIVSLLIVVWASLIGIGVLLEILGALLEVPRKILKFLRREGPPDLARPAPIQPMKPRQIIARAIVLIIGFLALVALSLLRGGQ